MPACHRRARIVLLLTSLVISGACGSSTDSSTPVVGLTLRVTDSTGSSRTYSGHTAQMFGPSNLGNGVFGLDFVATDDASPQDTVRRMSVTVSQPGLDNLTGSHSYGIQLSGAGPGASASLELIPGFANWAADSGTITLTALDNGDVKVDVRVRMPRVGDPAQKPVRVRATLVATSPTP